MARLKVKVFNDKAGFRLEPYEVSSIFDPDKCAAEVEIEKAEFTERLLRPA